MSQRIERLRQGWQGELEKRYPELCGNIYCGAYAPDGWKPIIEEALDALQALPFEVKIAQIKSKWGGLRIYFDLNTDSTKVQHKQANEIVSAAESKIWKLENEKVHSDVQGDD